ncbi:PrsW family intramembrane metalloprotease [Lachnoclostridium sp. Marseille-P6806]|uniref:PrsW family intramembrane metalloprotease n=1 Tax=Lachnoclostridium sp. Marseille-P6806 TaxID=2364793 RepID=UPI0010305408|nr:PrsW family intramembrane metalloprotease [Lachnoclostridium sp. Marseille-P6806]
MFLVLPGLVILGIYLSAAVLPALALLLYIYRQDRVEHEPVGLIGKLLLGGVFAGLCAIVLETIGEAILPRLIDPQRPAYTIALAFLVVAGSEEGSKYYFMQRQTWRSREFNYRFDGVIYAAAVSLGFAAFENIEYVFGYGLSVAPMRALLAIPGHLSFAVFMGTFYGRAKFWHDLGDERRAKQSKRFACLSAIFFHGFYDACAMIGTGLSTLVFLIFVVVMYVLAFRLVRSGAATDTSV